MNSYPDGLAKLPDRTRVESAWGTATSREAEIACCHVVQHMKQERTGTKWLWQKYRLSVNASRWAQTWIIDEVLTDVTVWKEGKNNSSCSKAWSRCSRDVGCNTYKYIICNWRFVSATTAAHTARYCDAESENSSTSSNLAKEAQIWW
jgi:hypothetical protein